jgi:hypothetical protein
MTCAVCQHPTAHDYCKPAFMGRSEPLCWYCFLAWYENGQTTDEGIRCESMRSRHDETTLREFR